MQITTSFDVPVLRDQTWDLLLDVERIAPCMPGATLDSHDGDLYHGRVKLKLGPILAQYAGTMQITDRDPDAGSLSMLAKGSEKRGTGRAEATIRAQLTEITGGTRVDIDAALKLSGRAAQFGRSVLQDVSKRLITAFADNLAEELRPTLRPVGAPTVNANTSDSERQNLNILSLLAANTRVRVAAGLLVLFLAAFITWAWV